MALTPEQEWTLVACGLMAHADEILEVGEWDHILRLVGGSVAEEDEAEWLDRLADRGALEKRFKELQPPPPVFSEQLLQQCWRVALADGSGSEIEAAVHDHIGERLGIDPDQAASWREEWTRAAGARAELVLGFAAILANADDRLDSGEAVQFESLLERMPVSVGRRVELSTKLVDPPDMEEVVMGLSDLPAQERIAALQDLAPFVNASARGEREKKAFLDLAERIAVPTAEAERLLD
jgi:hypothetical protein